MKLYTVPLAPNPTKVMLYLAERAARGAPIDIEQIIVNTLKGRHKAPEHLARNPFGTLPVLELDDGSYIIESLAIIDYLEERFPEGALRPTTAESNARARALERVVELKITNPIGQWVHLTNSPLGYAPDPERAAQLEPGIHLALDYLETLLSDGRPFLTGNAPSTADCTLAAGLQFMRFAKGELLGDRPGLKQWDQQFRSHGAGKAVLQW